MKYPLCEWVGVNDGYGLVGYVWNCTECGNQSSFTTPCAGDFYRCNKCGQDHLSDFEEDE